jgi:hypothetical protein
MGTNMVLSGIIKGSQRRHSHWPTLLAASVLVACPHARAVQVELSADIQGDLRPTIHAATNLPNGMKLLVRVTRQESAFQFETPVEVQSGILEAGPLSQGGDDLNPGTYSLEIVSAPFNDQPDAVRALAGRKGEELHGALTKRHAGATSVRLLTSFQIGPAANPELDRARREQLNWSKTQWWRKNCTDICSGGERYAAQKSEQFDRRVCMKTCIANPPTVSR